MRELRWDTEEGAGDNLTTESAPQPLEMDRRYHSWTAMRYSGTDLSLSSYTEEDDDADPAGRIR